MNECKLYYVQIDTWWRQIRNAITKSKNLVPPGLEPGTFRVLGERDNHYTTELLPNI